jgi:agmatine/peptidylarginine deiminase
MIWQGSGTGVSFANLRLMGLVKINTKMLISVTSLLIAGLWFQASGIGAPTDYGVPPKTILLSEYVLDDDSIGPSLVEAIVDAGSKVTVLVEDPLKPEEYSEWFEARGLEPKHQPFVSFETLEHDSYWVRDYGGIFTSTGDPESEEMQVTAFHQPEKWSHNQKASEKLAEGLNASFQKFSPEIDGGSILFNQSDCFTSLDVEKGSDESNEVVALMKAHLGCARVINTRSSPHEHIDMWAVSLGPGVIAVNYLSQDQLDLMGEGSENYLENRELQSRLDSIAKQLSKYLTVERIPMPLKLGDHFFTYSNSLQVNSTFIVPRYSDMVLFESQEKIDQMEGEVKELLNRYGYASTFINADTTIKHGGAIHCVTLEVPWRRLPQ